MLLEISEVTSAASCALPQFVESKVTVWPAVMQWSVWSHLLPLKRWSDVPVSVRGNVRGNRETEVVSRKDCEVSLSGQFQFQSDLIHFTKGHYSHGNVTSYHMWFEKLLIRS